MATTVVGLLYLLSFMRTVDMRTLSDNDIDRFDAVIDDAADKFLSAEYLYLDDPSPGDYFDNITSAANVLTGALNESTAGKMRELVSAFEDFFDDASAKIGEQATPFGFRECRLLPKQFRNCLVEPRAGETLHGIKKSLRKWQNSELDEDLHNALIVWCEEFDAGSPFKMSIALMGEQCEAGPSEDGSIEQDIQRRMMQYAKENGFEGGNENNCLHLFVARFTQSSEAVKIFMTAVDKYLLTTTTAQAVCTVFRPMQSEENNREKAVQAQRTLAESLARAQLNGSEPWMCNDTQSDIDAAIASVDVARLSEIIEVAKEKVSSGDYFFNDPSAAEYFDNIRTVAGFAAVVMEERMMHRLMEKWSVIEAALTSFFRELSSTADELVAPFGLNECWLLPAEISDNSVLPIISTVVDSMLSSFRSYSGGGGYDWMAYVCETSNVDDFLKTLRALVGKDCAEGSGQNGTIEEVCLHLFIARYTKSEQAIRMFKKSFDKYFLASVTIQSVCSAFIPKCNEEAYRAQVVDTHASFAESLARIASIQTRKADLLKRTRSTLLRQMEDLMAHLADTRSELSIPFGQRDGGLLPQAASCSSSCDSVFRLDKFLEELKSELRSSSLYLDKKNSYHTKNVCRRLRTESILNAIVDFIGPACEYGLIHQTFDASTTWRRQLFLYATAHGFPGCDDNKCLHIFVARYTNHSQEALKKLQHSVDKYVYVSVFLKSYCDSFSIDEEIRSKSRSKTLEMARSMKSILSNISSQAGAANPCEKGSIEIDREWSENVNSYAKEVIGNETDRLKPRSWEDRQGLHEAVAKDIAEHLDNVVDGYSHDALAYLPYADAERHAFIKLSSNIDVTRNEFKSVNYVVCRRTNDAVADTISGWDVYKSKENEILEATFSTRATSLATRIEEVEKQFGPFLSQDGFRALVALRCGYEFVWYELGYRYFAAGYATGNHTLFTRGGNKYSDKCGQIVLFP